MLAVKLVEDNSKPVGSARAAVDVRRANQCKTAPLDDHIAMEVPVAMVYNGISHAVMMATPADLKDFALGFSLSEGILTDTAQLFDCDVKSVAHGLSVEMRIANSCLAALKQRRRNLTGRTGCGLCGTESLESAIRPVRNVTAPVVSDDAVQRALKMFPQYQALQAKTGASHGVAWCDLAGNIVKVREDVGRHNALDKLIGALLQTHTDLNQGFVLVSSRASYEMVHKSCAVGIGALVAVSAPTSLAIEQAAAAGQLLIGFAREGRHVIYNNPWE
ncbi:formate dehydrogenase accessory sulfurtransferase FdhD [Zhongshania guokunii]|uniref:Sulfur carrier protein FdhD n=1 Tax=Zhongshania guokunii TaxID=641783 RepID=A0ABV3U090_9GAMM